MVTLIRGRLEWPCLIVACSTLGLGACGAQLPSAGTARAAAKAVPARPREQPPNPDAEMVNAVPAGKPAGGYNLKFSLKERPTAGQPLEIEIAVTPAAATERIQVVFRGNDGLELRSGGSMPPVEKPDSSVPLHHTLIVVPKSEGIFSVSAVVLSESADGSVSRAYSIPVIVGAGLAEPGEADARAEAGTDTHRPAT
jgi:hypothetical protein